MPNPALPKRRRKPTVVTTHPDGTVTASGPGAKKAAAKQRRANARVDHILSHPIVHAETEDSGLSFSDALRTAATAIPVTPAQWALSDNPITKAARDYLTDSAENAVDVAGGNLDKTLRGERTLGELPSEKELRLAADLAALTPIGAGAKGGEGLAAAARAIRASKQVAEVATKQGLVRGAAKAVAEKAEPAAVRALRSSAAH